MTRPTHALASHSYFFVRNKDEQKQLFLADDTYSPVFTYHSHFDFDIVGQRLSSVDEQRAQKSLQLVLASLQLQHDPHDVLVQRSFRLLNEELFITPTDTYADAIIERARTQVTPQTQGLWDYIAAQIEMPAAGHIDIVPSDVTFQRYRSYLRQYYQVVESDDILDEFRKVLENTGLTTDGWSLHVLDDASHARVNHATKRVVVGKEYQPRTSKARHRIVIHEVLGHALRGSQDTIAESEGVAVLLEQLLDDRFKLRRTYRYLAAALGWGALGHQRTFREVYEIIWRLMVIVSRYKEASAKSHAFDECVRVFRGGVPDVPGMVYIKDTVYFASNIAVWNQLERSNLSYNEFIDIIEGRRKVLA